MDTTVAARPARARLAPWAHDARTAHLVLLDHQMVPDQADVAGWIAAARADGARAMRTGALFPPATSAFVDAGFRVAETLTLLTRTLTARPTDAGLPGADRAGAHRTRKLRRHQLDDAARVDAASFAGTWSNDAEALADIMAATPKHRARVIRLDGGIVGFAISGLAARTGYLQRLAVTPARQRHGLARALVADSLAWMRRHGAELAMVNTASDNDAALSLYRSFGFVEQPQPLLILERELDT